MKILVTGANGFVGNHLCQKLLDLGHTVFGLVRTPLNFHLTHPRLTIIKGDLNHPQLNWVDSLPHDLDACIHTAGLVHTYYTNDFFRVNTKGTQYLIESFKNRFKNQFKFKFIFISSLAAGGPVKIGEIKNEVDIDFPVSDYGRSKKEAELLLKTYAPKEWTISIIRPPMIIGPGDTAVLDIFKMVKSGFVLLPGLNSKIKEYSFVCVFDLITTVTKVLEADLALTLYSSHESIIKFQELITEIKKQMNKKWIFYIPFPFFILKMLGFWLKIIHTFFPHKLRLTPDKLDELKAEAWTCHAEISKTTLKQIYQYDLKQTISVTLTDYQKRRWL